MADIAVQLQKIASNATIQAQKLANQATEKSFQYNAKEANTARTWQKMMSDTAHQREVEDLKKAGLNPVLSTNQGAQSYTTSSAQSQANDPSGAAASLAASQMSGMAQGYSADKAAAATRYAAQQSAAAMRAAAAQSAAAQTYAADRAYAAQKYAWDKKQEMQKYEYKNKPVTNWSGLIDKYAQNTGLSNATVSSKTVKNVVKGFSFYANNPGACFKQGAVGNFKAGVNVFSNLTKPLQNKIDNSLSRFGITQNKTTRNLFARAVLNGSLGAWNTLIRYMPKKVKVIDKYNAYSMR